MGEDTASELYQSGRDAMDRGDFTTAVGHLQRALALRPHYKTLELLGTALRELQRPEEALVYLAAAAGLGNRQFRARYLLAEVLVGLGLTDDAIVKLEEAIELNPSYRTARELLERIRATRPEPT
ncbi:MAG TPA: tetratricopeptide repeat protein [Vicinamibacterales bacterium]|nr:tetratricopeptide repeat protein [Vicinamibacterales bacterium]